MTNSPFIESAISKLLLQTQCLFINAVLGRVRVGGVEVGARARSACAVGSFWEDFFIFFNWFM